MWRNFLILWVIVSVQSTWRCYRNLELLVEKYGKNTFHVRYIDNDPEWRIKDLSHLLSLLNTDVTFNYWIQSSILRKIAPDNWILEPRKQNISTLVDDVGVPNNYVEINARNPIKAAIGRMGFDHVPGTSLIRPLFAFLINLLPRLPATQKFFLGLDEEAEKEFPLQYLSFLNSFLEETLPLAYGDSLTAILDKAERLKFYPGRLTITHAASVDTYNHLLNVLSVEKGERVVGNQHGGWYGTGALVAWAPEAEYIYHAFITWGWTSQSDFYGNMRPLPSPMLSKIRNAHKNKNNDLILVGTKMLIQNDRLEARPSTVRWLNYRKIKRDFIESLDSEPRRALRYRPYNRSKPLLEDETYIKRYFPDLPILQTSLQKAFLKCRMVVLDHPGTTLHLVMAANVPTVCYWNRKDWPICPQAELQFDLLRAADIVFDCPEKAAAHVTKIWGDVSGWWNRPVVKNARAEWVDYHARASVFWWWHWATGIWRLATGRSPKIIRKYTS